MIKVYWSQFKWREQN